MSQICFQHQWHAESSSDLFPNTYTLCMTPISIPSVLFYYCYTKQQKNPCKLSAGVFFPLLDFSRAFLQRNSLSLSLDSDCLKAKCCFFMHMIRGSRRLCPYKSRRENISVLSQHLLGEVRKEYVFLLCIKSYLRLHSPLPSALPFFISKFQVYFHYFHSKEVRKSRVFYADPL